MVLDMAFLYKKNIKKYAVSQHHSYENESYHFLIIIKHLHTGFLNDYIGLQRKGIPIIFKSMKSFHKTIPDSCKLSLFSNQ